jgi:plastocyanin
MHPFLRDRWVSGSLLIRSRQPFVELGMTPRLISAIAPGLAALALAACGSSSGSSSSAASSGASSASTSSSSSATTPADQSGKVASGHVTVVISNYKFAPAKLTVKSGTRVTFSNHDMTAHTATANSGFDSGTIKPRADATVKFSKPGTYPYICQFHAFMHGTVVVQ